MLDGHMKYEVPYGGFLSTVDFTPYKHDLTRLKESLTVSAVGKIDIKRVVR